MGSSLATLGFGYIVGGTVLLRPREGNPKPRLVRDKSIGALTNSLGFPSQGLEKIVRNLKSVDADTTKFITSISGLSTEEFLTCYSELQPLSAGIELNISSPNTEDLRCLQEGDALQGLLDGICREREKLDAERGKTTPVLIKLAPDWEEGALEASIGMIREYPLDGIVATNTTIERPHLKSPLRIETGGLSGAPVFGLSTDILRTLYRELRSKMPIIGVGGIFSGKDAYKKIRSGASAVQIYTSLVYEGPGVVATIKRELEKLLLRDGLVSVADAVGLDADRPVQE